MKLTCVLLVITGLLVGCTEQKQTNTDLRIALTAWPGAEYLYLASELGFFQQAGINVKIIQLSSFSDARQAFASGKVDAISQTLFELIKSQQIQGQKAKAVLLTDFSNGADVLIALKDTNSMSDLEGKRIATDYSPLSLFFISQSLATAGLSLADVELFRTDEHSVQQLLQQRTVAAAYSYHPYANQILESDEFHVLNDSSQMPMAILDTLTISEQFLLQHPGVVAKIKRAWQQALAFAAQHPIQAYSKMAKRERLELDEFLNSLNGIEVLSIKRQNELLADRASLQKLTNDICIMFEQQDIQRPCPKVEQIIYFPEHKAAQ